MKYAIKEMLKIGGGSIVNVSALYGEIAAPYFAPSTASKHAVNGLTKAAALEYTKQGIRVNAIAPGHVVTDLFTNILDSTSTSEEDVLKTIPTGKFGSVEEIANGIIYLASPENTFLTGSILTIDGGKTIQ